MKRLGISFFFAALWAILIYSTYWLISTIPQVGMRKSSETIEESIKRKVFIAKYKLINRSSYLFLGENPIFWSENSYRTPSINLSNTEIIKGSYQLHAFVGDHISSQVKERQLIVGCRDLKFQDDKLFQPIWKGSISLRLFAKDSLPDTLKIYRYLRPLVIREEPTRIDSMTIVRIQ